jgi:ferredoxin
MPIVTYLPTNQTIALEPHENLLDAARRCEIPIHSTCGGVARCADCKVKIIETNEKLPRPNDAELTMIGSAHFVTKERLACQLQPTANITVEILNPFTVKPR